MVDLRINNQVILIKIMRNFETIIDFGSKNLRIGVFDKTLKNIYSSSIKLNNSLENSELEKSLNTLIRDAEKNLSTHIENVLLLYDSKIIIL